MTPEGSCGWYVHAPHQATPGAFRFYATDWSGPQWGAEGSIAAGVKTGANFKLDTMLASNRELYLWEAPTTQRPASALARVRFDDPALTVSEGIGYGMLASVFADDGKVSEGPCLMRCMSIT